MNRISPASLLRNFVAILFATALAGIASAAPTNARTASKCYRSSEVVACLIDLAKQKLARVTDANERADAVGDLLYTLSTTGNDDATVAKEAAALAGDRAVKPVKQMDLLYSVDIRDSTNTPPAQDSYAAALRRFATLERNLSGNDLAELYLNACLIIDWDDPFRERWMDFAQNVCTADRLREAKADSFVSHTLLLAMMPVAMMLADDRDGFESSADEALAWLDAAEKAASRSKDADGKDFVAAVGVLMHTTNAICLNAFDESDAANEEVDNALKALHRIEKRRGISGTTTPLRRQVVESLFDAGRDAEAAKLLQGMLSSVDRDRAGKKIPFAEQVSILLLAARIAHYLDEEREQEDVPAGHIRM